MDLKNGFMIYKYIKDLDWIGEKFDKEFDFILKYFIEFIVV
jgi:hypothetical protein